MRANADGTFDIAQSGQDLSWGNIGYNFMWQPVKGDFTLMAKIDSLAIPGSWMGRKAGLMVRSSLDATAMMRAYGVKRTGGNFYVIGMHKTSETGSYVREHGKVSDTTYPNSYGAASTWVRLVRTGNVFTCLYKNSKVAQWTKVYEYEDANGEYGDTAYVGLAAWGEGSGPSTAVPYYLWRFSEVLLRTPKGSVLSFR